MRVCLQFPVNHCYFRMSVSSLGTYNHALAVTWKHCLEIHTFTYCLNFELNCYCLDLFKLCFSFTHFIGDIKLLKGSGCKKIQLNQNNIYVFWLYINTTNMKLYKSARQVLQLCVGGLRTNICFILGLIIMYSTLSQTTTLTSVFPPVWCIVNWSRCKGSFI